MNGGKSEVFLAIWAGRRGTIRRICMTKFNQQLKVFHVVVEPCDAAFDLPDDRWQMFTYWMPLPESPVPMKDNENELP
jgi:hypothetical protein